MKGRIESFRRHPVCDINETRADAIKHLACTTCPESGLVSVIGRRTHEYCRVLKCLRWCASLMREPTGAHFDLCTQKCIDFRTKSFPLYPIEETTFIPDEYNNKKCIETCRARMKWKVSVFHSFFFALSFSTCAMRAFFTCFTYNRIRQIDSYSQILCIEEQSKSNDVHFPALTYHNDTAIDDDW